MLPHSPPLISPPENLNYLVLITQFMTHFTRPKFMFQWISVSPPAVWICAVQFLGFVFSDSRFIVLVSLTIYFPIGFVSPPQFPIFAITRGTGGGVYWPRSQAVCGGWWNKRPLASGFVRLCDRIVCSEGFQPGQVTAGHRQAFNCTDSQFHQLAEIERKSLRYDWDEDCCFTGSPFFECVNMWLARVGGGQGGCSSLIYNEGLGAWAIITRHGGVVE